MSPKFLSALQHYLWGLFATAWNAGWTSVGGIVGIDAVAISGVSTEVHVLSWHAMLSGFLGSAIVHMIMWINKHPLKEDYDTNPPMGKP